MTNDFFDRPLVWDRSPSQRIFIEVLKKILEFVGKRLEIPQQSIFVSLIHLVSCCSSVCKRATSRLKRTIELVAIPDYTIIQSAVQRIRSAMPKLLKDARLTN